jgi:chemotaxis protein MotB
MLGMVASGCATKLKQRIATFEETNRNLTQRLNASQGELDLLASDRDELDMRLQGALDEISSLQTELAERPAPTEAPAGWRPIPGGAMIAIAGHVLFEPGKPTLRKEARKTLDGIVSTVQGEYADKGVLVFGHTDDQPIKKSGWTDNYELSTERALAVVRYLRDHGVPPGRLAACGWGEHRPLVPNSSSANRSANRRVEIFAVGTELFAAGP